jgi:hypothetical protein
VGDEATFDFHNFLSGHITSSYLYATSILLNQLLSSHSKHMDFSSCLNTRLDPFHCGVL